MFGIKAPEDVKLKTILTKKAVARLYNCKHVTYVIDHTILSPVERTKAKERIKYKVVKKLPSIGEYKKQRDQKYTTTVGQLVADAFGEVQSLMSELEDWLGNLPESFQNGDKGQALQDAIDQLSQVCEPHLEDDEKAKTLVFLPNNDPKQSRSDRAYEAKRMFTEAAERLRQNETADEIESQADELECIDFPGMY